VTAPELTVDHLRAAVASVVDPEMPFLTIEDLGVLRAVSVEGTHVIVTVTPTYSGCPAMTEMMTDIKRRLVRAGAIDHEIRVALAPAWTTGWITEAGRRKLAEAGIAPPSGVNASRGGPVPLTLVRSPQRIACPRCGSFDTSELSQFSATACKSLHRCALCREPFEQLKDLA